jgi:hypothetical protein
LLFIGKGIETQPFFISKKPFLFPKKATKFYCLYGIRQCMPITSCGVDFHRLAKLHAFNGSESNHWEVSQVDIDVDDSLELDIVRQELKDHFYEREVHYEIRINNE